RWPVEAPEDVHEGRLARSGYSHERDDLAARDRERDPLEHRDVDLAQMVGLVEVLDPDQVHGGDSRGGKVNATRPAINSQPGLSRWPCGLRDFAGTARPRVRSAWCGFRR